MTYEDFGIDVEGQTSGTFDTTCPKCSATRKKSTQKCLRVDLDRRSWFCIHCGYNDRIKMTSPLTPRVASSSAPERKPSVEVPYQEVGTEELYAWFAGRGISKEIVQRNHIGAEYQWMTFPYYRDGKVVNIKFRGFPAKMFRQHTGGEKVLYGYDQIVGDTVVIVEGEIDKLSLEMAEVRSAVSVPDGAPAINSQSFATKFDYLENCAAKLDALEKIIIAVDSDLPGIRLADELIRRLGPERCWRVTWPSDCKDANEVLLRHGASVLRDCIAQAKPLPIEGLFCVEQVRDDVLTLYRQGMPGGVDTGWAPINRHFTVRPGEMTVVTGAPSHGKSEWLDNLAVNLAHIHDWRVGIFSPENFPLQQHLAKLMEKHAGHPFKGGYNVTRMTEEAVLKELDWLNEHFYFAMNDEQSMSCDGVLKKAKQMVKRYGIRAFILDPWNEIDHTRTDGSNETEYISKSLTKIRRFARSHGVHFFIVAHPTKLYRNKADGTYPVPTLYDISGSAHWYNKADNGIVVFRNIKECKEDDQKISDIYFQKIRFKEVGKIGFVQMQWIPGSGRYQACDTNNIAMTAAKLQETFGAKEEATVGSDVGRVSERTERSSRHDSGYGYDDEGDQDGPDFEPAL